MRYYRAPLLTPLLGGSTAVELVLRCLQQLFELEAAPVLGAERRKHSEQRFS